MSVAVSYPPSGPPLSTLLLRRFTVDEYHQMIRAGILTEDEPVELLEGWIVIKMARTPEHDLAVEKSDVAIRDRLPSGWRIRIQCAVTTDDSEPEPDIALVRGPLPATTRSHPRPSEIGLLVEVFWPQSGLAQKGVGSLLPERPEGCCRTKDSRPLFVPNPTAGKVAESSLIQDRTAKARTYARNAIPVYWVINLRDRQVEVYTEPLASAPQPSYRTRRDYAETDAVPLVLDGLKIASLPVRDLLP